MTLKTFIAAVGEKIDHCDASRKDEFSPNGGGPVMAAVLLFPAGPIVTLKGRITGEKTATAGSDVVQSGRPIFDDFFQRLWPYIGNNTANVVFQMAKRLWLIRIDQ
ncbi:hypothetical protein TNCV_4640111 [Trichonephila clavipes]|nr:hypothetical protein TNCV_4640111 [Trichonephila clavipes]